MCGNVGNAIESLMKAKGDINKTIDFLTNNPNLQTTKSLFESPKEIIINDSTVNSNDNSNVNANVNVNEDIFGLQKNKNQLTILQTTLASVINEFATMINTTVNDISTFVNSNVKTFHTAKEKLDELQKIWQKNVATYQQVINVFKGFSSADIDSFVF